MADELDGDKERLNDIPEFLLPKFFLTTTLEKNVPAL